jgi:hypothetical protein
MDERDVADELLSDHLTVAGAPVDLQLRYLPDAVRSRVFDAVRNQTCHVELRTRIDEAKTELVLVPADGTEPLWLTRTSS